MATIVQLLQQHSKINSESPRLDAELLLCSVLDKPRSHLYAWSEQVVEVEAERQYLELLERRVRGEPVAYILGYREFWSLALEVNNSTLIPRPETELLVEWALELDLPDKLRVLDMGTGTGAIALALATERNGWRIDACDCNREAVLLAEKNRRRLGVENVRIMTSNWFAAIEAQHYGLIVSNPPYVKATDIHLQCGDLRFEPRSALVGGDDGLSALKTIIAGAGRFLSAGSWLLLEHGRDQAQEVQCMLEQHGFIAVATRRDISGQNRVTGGKYTYE